ncbi:hypothetical protein HGRIS_010564 [Hohenbuehelia grisea]|uniref:NACHT domain-containing protein n=1 Tax=Hohenbuehelia grisea TaxID=104357 RepID=A0ABR3IXD0_9AGAR
MSVQVGGSGSFSQYYNPQFNNIGRDQVINHNYGDDASTFLDTLKHATDAGPDPLKLCLPGTRMRIRSCIWDWALSPNSSRALLLSGVAGRGKSAIVHQLARELEDSGFAVAPFFAFNRSNRDRHFSKLAFTWAKGLARRCPQYLLYLRELDISSLERAPPLEQHHALLFREKAHVAMEKPVVFVIDALDECPENEFNHLYRLLTQLLSSLTLPTSYRFLLTCRPNQRIDEIFDQPSAWKISLDSEEHTIDDIRAFVQHELQGYSVVRPLVNDVVSASQGVFECAAVLCRELTIARPRSFDAHQRLVNAMRTQKTTSLYGTYRQVLDIYIKHDEGLLKAFRRLMCWIFLVRSPQRRQVYHEFAAISLPLSEQSDVYVVLSWLGSLLSGATSDSTPILPLHTSLRDFLVNRSESDIYCVDLGTRAQQELALVCLKVMNTKLQFNICHLPTSCILNTEIPDLQERVATYISPGLQYASLTAAFHLQGTTELPPHGPHGRDGQSALGAHEHDSLAMVIALAAELDRFLAKKFLYWLEAHSCMRTSTGGPAAMLPQFLAWSKSVRNTDSESVLIECIKFEKRFREGYMLSAPQVYYSGLVFQPKASKLTKICGKLVDVPVTVARGREKTWPPTETLVIRVNEPIRCIAISPDGTKIISGHQDDDICVWNVETGEQVGAPLQGHSHWVNSVAFSPDGTKIVSGSKDNTVRVWEVETGKQVGAPLQGHSDWVNSVSFSLDGTKIVSGSDDSTVRVWDVETGEQIGAPLRGHGDVKSIAFSPDGTKIVSGSADSTVRVWDVETGDSEQVGTPLRGHGDVKSIAFLPDGTKIVSGSADSTVRVWDVETGEQVGAPLQGHSNCVNSVAFSPDGTKIVSGSYDLTVRVWDVETGEQVGVPLRGHWDVVNSVAFSPDGTKIVSGSADSTVRVWEVETGEQVCAPPQGHWNVVNSVAFSPDGTKIVSGSADSTVRVWDVETGQQVGAPLQGHAHWVNSVAFSPDGTKIVSGSKDNTVRVWEVETGKQVGAPLQGHSDWVNSVSFSLDGTKIVSGSDDSTVRVWDVETGEQIGAPLRGHGDVKSIAFSPDGTKIVSGSADSTVRVWDVETGDSEQVGTPLRGHGDVKSIAFLPDGTKIVSGSADRTVRVWDVETEEQVGAPLQGHSDWVNSVAFSPDGTKIVSGSEDNTIRVWDVETGEQVGVPLRGHGSGVNSVAFSPDGTKIVSGSTDHIVRVWDVETGQQVGAPLRGHGNVVKSVAFSPHPGPKNDSENSPGKPFLLRRDDWIAIVEPTQELRLLWIPHAFRGYDFGFYPCVMLMSARPKIRIDMLGGAWGTRWMEILRDSEKES